MIALGLSLWLLVQETVPSPSQTGQESAAARSESDEHKRMESIRAAVEKGLSFLAHKQAEEPDGSLPRADAQQYAPTGVTALAALAFMGGGGAGRGPFADNALRAIDFLLSLREGEAGSDPGYIHADNDPHSRMHGHGYATLALAEAYGMYEGRRGREWGEKLRGTLLAAVRRIEESQGESGGWYYSPRREIQHEGSVTIVLVQALRAARNAGVQVDRSVIDRAVDYVRRLQKEDGSFRYQLGSEQSTAALTAAGIATLNATGVYDGPAVERGVGFLLRHFEKRRLTVPFRDTEPFREYGRLYTAQALYQHRDRELWKRWFEETAEEIMATQRPDGSWSGNEFGSVYGTAVNCLVLEISFDYLPIFQR